MRLLVVLKLRLSRVDLSPMTICEEFLYGITIVGFGNRERTQLGLYGIKGFLAIPTWWYACGLNVRLVNKKSNYT